MAVTMKSVSSKVAKKKAPPGKSKVAGKKPGWAMKGQAAKEALAHEEQQAELNKSQKGKPWRFRLKT